MATIGLVVMSLAGRDVERRVLEDHAAHEVGAGQHGAMRDHAAERMADKDRRLPDDLVEESDRVARVVIEDVGAGRVGRLAVTPSVEGHDPVAAGERAGQASPRRPCAAQTVQQHHRVEVGLTAVVERQHNVVVFERSHGPRLYGRPLVTGWRSIAISHLLT